MKNTLLFMRLFLILMLFFAVNATQGYEQKDRTDNEQFSYQMEQSMQGLECAMKGYYDKVRCTIYCRNK